MNNPSRYERLFRPTDTDDLRAQIRAIVDRSPNVDRLTDHQLKIGNVNYYPGKGTITIDPHHRHPKKGLDALFEVLELQGITKTL
jgi:DNA-binding response OmpR family regulator